MSDIKELIERIERNEFFFENFTEEEVEIYSKNKEVMLAFIKIDSAYIQNVDNSLLMDEDFLKNCIREEVNEVINDYIPEVYLNNKNFMEYATKINPHLILKSPFVNDEDWIKDLLVRDAYLFGYLPKNMRENKEVVLIALEVIEKWSDFLEALSNKFLGDKEFVSNYLTEAYEILDYITEDLQKDKELIIKIIKENPNPIDTSSIHVTLQEDMDILNTLIICDPEAFLSFKENIKVNIEIVSKLVNENLKVLEYVHEDIYLNKDFLMRIKENFLNNEESYKRYPQVLCAIRAFEREDALKEKINKKNGEILKNKKKI